MSYAVSWSCFIGGLNLRTVSCHSAPISTVSYLFSILVAFISNKSVMTLKCFGCLLNLKGKKIQTDFTTKIIFASCTSLTFFPVNLTLTRQSEFLLNPHKRHKCCQFNDLHCEPANLEKAESSIHFLVQLVKLTLALNTDTLLCH